MLIAPIEKNKKPPGITRNAQNAYSSLISTLSPQQFIFLSALMRSKATVKQHGNLSVDKYLKQADL